MVFLAICFTVHSIELEKCLTDRMNEGQCKDKVKSNPSFCNKGAGGEYDYARAYCCRSCVVAQGWIKANDSLLPGTVRVCRRICTIENF